MKHFVAVDMGASSIRVIVSNGNELDEIYRFKNSFKTVNDSCVWDMEYIFSNIKTGLKLALEKYHNIESMAIDSWGCDYVLLDNNHKEILPAYAYRDFRTNKSMNLVHEILSEEELYRITGISPQPYNTIYQLYADKIEGRLKDASCFLSVPEYIAFRLTGNIRKEYSMASTTGLLDVITKDYSEEIISKLGFRKDMFIDIFDAGDFVGDFKKEIQKELGGNIKVHLALSHDTAGAYYAVNIYDAPILSSGTWSLLGVMQDEPHNDISSLKNGFTNEAGYKRRFTYLKNIMGMWIINNLTSEFNVTIQELIEIAKNTQYESTFDVNDSSLLNPKSMFKAICKLLNIEDKDSNKNLVFKSSLLSLAKSYATSVKELETVVNKTYEIIVIVGGGANNKYLNELTEKYSGKKVIALPIEASSIGNILSQKGGN